MTALPEKMRAAVLRSPGEPLTIEDGITVPKPGPGQVLIAMHYAGLCRSQLLEARGLRGEDRFLPHLLGHEGCGTVATAGAGVSKVSQGDRVVLTWIKASGADSGGTTLQLGDETIHAGPVTTFSEYTLVSENRCVPCPESLPSDVAVLLGCALLTGGGIVRHTLAANEGDSLGVVGVGGVGASALIEATLAGCMPRLAIDVCQQKLDLARRLGATHTIDASQEDALTAVLAEVPGGLDHCVEATGTVSGIELAFELIRRGGGELVFASHPPFGERVSFDPFEMISGKQVRGSWGGDARPDLDIPRYAGLYEEQRLPLRELLTAPYSLDKINQALDDLEQGQIPRGLIEIAPRND